MGGRGATSGQGGQTTNTSTIIGTMGGGSMAAVQGATGPVTFQMQQQPPTTVATPQQAQANNNQIFKDTDNSPYHQLHSGAQYYKSQNLTVSQQMACMDYIDPNPTQGSLYSASQNLNTAMVKGQRLTAQQDYVKNMLLSGMHNLGYNVNLTRYDHSAFANGLLKGAGLDMNTASVAQMKNALVGMNFSENRFLSTSYNNFKNAPTSNSFTDRQVKITYRAKANTQVIMPGDTRDRYGNKLSWGEMVISPGMKQTVVDVREISKTGARAKGMPQGFTGARQIEIIIEVER